MSQLKVCSEIVKIHETVMKRNY